ncbi:MAG: hypothetical protein WCF12_02510 [Propionicimonas sp.]
MAAPSKNTNSRSTPAASREEMVQVRLVAASVEAFEQFAENAPIAYACEGPRRDAEGRVTAEVFLTRAEAKRAGTVPGVSADVVADSSAAATEADIGVGNRFEDARTLPTGRGVLLREAASRGEESAS